MFTSQNQLIQYTCIITNTLYNIKIMNFGTSFSWKCGRTSIQMANTVKMGSGKLTVGKCECTGAHLD